MNRWLKTGGWIVGGAALVAALGFGSVLVFPRWWQAPEYLAATSELAATSTPSATSSVPSIEHLSTPEPVRALYLTQCAAASPALREHVLGLATTTEINAIVVDLKDYSGTVIFPSATAVPGGKGCADSQFRALVKRMHEAGIYVIGRLTVFQDPLYTKVHPEEAVQSKKRANAATPLERVWRDRKDLAFVDVSSEPFHTYIATLANEAIALGVDEINFDYIRYPSDGDMEDTHYIDTGRSHAENLEHFFQFLSDNVPAVRSADLFGMTASNYDDLGIGQVLERAMPYFDYVAPMVYPSHYPKGFNGWADPNQHPYDIIHFSLSRAIARATATTTLISTLAYKPLDPAATTTPRVYQKPSFLPGKIRPWLQDFNYPVPYTPEMVEAQIQATYDVGLTSWMLWDPANRYTASVLKTYPRP